MQLKFFQIQAGDYLAEEELNKFLRSHRVLRIERGHLPLDWTVARLTEKHSSKPFNPDIANAFFRSGEIESWGRGIERILTACQAAHCPAPIIDYTPGDFWLKFAFAPEHLAKTITEPSSGKSSGKTPVKTPVKILQLLLTNKSHHSTGKNKPRITRMNTDTKKWARVHSLREWGRVKQKLCKQACKILLFSANPSSMRSSVSICEIRG